MAQQYPMGTENGIPYISGSSYYTPYQQNGMQQAAYTPQDFPQSHMSAQGGYDPSNVVNIGRFESNSQIHPSGPPFQFPPSTFTSDMFKQFPNVAHPPAQPPSFPSIPQPRYGLSSLSAPMGSNPSSVALQYNSDGFLGSNIGNTNVKNMNRDIHTNANGGFGPAAGSAVQRVEMDLDEGEISRSLSSQTAPQDRPALQQQNISLQDPSPHISSLLESRLPISMSQSNNNNSRILSQTNSWQPNLQTSMLMNNANQSFNTLTSGNTEKIANDTVYQSNESKEAPSALSRAIVPNSNSAETTKSIVELRQLAKGAVLSLVSHNIQCFDLVKEGIDPSILIPLYEELGIQSQVLRNQFATVPDRTQAEPGTGSAAILASQNPEHGGITNKAQNESTRPLASNIQDMQSPSKPSLPATKTVQTNGRESPLSNSLINLRQPATVNPGLERKDRIAQLLAAKTGRINQAQSSPEPSPSVGNTTMYPSISVVGEDLGIQRPIASSTLAQDQAHPESGAFKAQIGLKEQITEQSKERAMAIDTIENQTSTHPESLQTDTALLEDSSSFGMWSALDTPVREEVMRSSLMHTIPGLFLTSAEIVEEERSAPTHNPAILSTSLDPEYLADEQMEANSRLPPHTKMHANNSIPSVLPVTANTKPTSSHMSSKRPLASDTFDEVFEPTTKRLQTEKHGDTNNTANLDGGEMDDASEGEIVETFEHSDTRPTFNPTQDSANQYMANENNQAGEVILNGGNRPPLLFGASSPDTLALPALSDSPGDGLYQAKQSEIEAMRKRIAEMELRKQLKKGGIKQESPQPSNSGPVDHSQTFNISGTETETGLSAAENVNSLLQGKPFQSRNISKLTPAQLAEKAASLKADLLRQRANRQKLLQAGLPDLNAEVQKSKDKLREIKAELNQVRLDAERYEADALRARELEHKLFSEVTRLEQHLQEGLSGQKQYSDELQNLEREDMSNSQPQPALHGDGRSKSASILLDHSLMTHNVGTENLRDLKPTSNEEPINKMQGNQGVDTEFRSRITSQSSSNGKSQPPQDLQSTELIDTESRQFDVQDLQATGVDQSEGAISETRHYFDTTTTVTEPQSSGESMQPSRKSSMEIDDNDDAEGSASMSDSGSDNEEYEPIDDEQDFISEQVSERIGSDSDEYDPEEAPVQDNEMFDTPDDDQNGEYEPTENTGITDTNQFEFEHNTSGEHQSGSSFGVAFAPADQISEEPQTQIPERVTTAIDTNGVDKIDNSLHESNPGFEQPNSVNISSDVIMPLSGDTGVETSRFTAYQSPLQSFKSYRFHPQFNDTVKNGYRSLTYSNSIDWNRPLCPTELAGETCQDPSCEEQHFRQLGLTDDKILVQMSSAADIKDKGQRDRYLMGLKHVIASLRQNGVKEFEKCCKCPLCISTAIFH